MSRTAQRIALVGAITASIIGYLCYVPNAKGIKQPNRVRALGALMKLVDFVVRTLISV